MARIFTTLDARATTMLVLLLTSECCSFSCHERIEGSTDTSLTFLNLDIRWRRVANFTPRSL